MQRLQTILSTAPALSRELPTLAWHGDDSTQTAPAAHLPRIPCTMAHNVAHVGRRQAESRLFLTRPLMRHAPVPLLMSTLRRLSALCLLVNALAGPAQARTEAPAAPQGQPQMNLPRTEMHIGMYRIDAQVAHTYDTRQTGLMFRQSMPSQEGMLFVFSQPGVQCFWMRNTVLPLTAAFVADDGTIVNLEDMKPMTETSHCSARPVRFVLEMNQGWFAQRGIKAGTKILGEAFRP